MTLCLMLCVSEFDILCMAEHLAHRHCWGFIADNYIKQLNTSTQSSGYDFGYIKFMHTHSVHVLTCFVEMMTLFLREL